MQNVAVNIEEVLEDKKMSDKTSLGDRMKIYEKLNATALMPHLPVIARIDGRAFHTFCRGFDKPFDMRMVAAMQSTTEFIFNEFNPMFAHTFSDEINLMWYYPEPEQQMVFGGKIQKLCSVLASAATLRFNEAKLELFEGNPIAERKAMFDCRVWNVPTTDEVANYFVWREQDAARNSLQMLSRAHYSHHELEGKKQADMHEMLYKKAINWNEQPMILKAGSYYRPNPTTPAELVKSRYPMLDGSLLNLPYSTDGKTPHEQRLRFIFRPEEREYDGTEKKAE